MFRSRILSLILLVSLVLGITAYATAGTAADPFISLSYLQEIFSKKVTSQLEATKTTLKDYGATAIDTAQGSQWALIEAQLNEAVAQRVAQKIADKVLEGSSLGTATMRKISLGLGDRVVGVAGSTVILSSGSAVLYGSQSSEILNLTLGGSRSPGPAATLNYCYMITADDGSGLQVTSASAEVYVRDGARVLRAYTPVHQAKADMLNEMGLFLGTTAGYELGRPPTRQEALIMLIRLLGEESAALAYEGASTFTDLVGWLDGQRYIIYAHNKGYTNGESATTFAQAKHSTLEMYLSFALRSLGYSDADGDFVWNTTSRDLAVEVGLLSRDDLADIDKGGFMRDHVVLISYNALGAQLKGSRATLGDKLVEAGAITSSQLRAWKTHTG